MEDRAISIALSAKGLVNIVANNHENDFTFHVGEAEYGCPSFIAEFISPRISSLRRTDPTIRDYRICTRDSTLSFGRFLSLGLGSSVSFGRNEFGTLQGFSRELCATEVFECLSTFDGELTVSNVIDRLLLRESIGCPVGLEIGFAAAHFSDLSESSISDLTASQLREIMSHSLLNIESEDWLYELIRKLILSNDEYTSLLECVGFEYLSSDSISDFFETIASRFGFLTIAVWARLRDRLISGFCRDTSKRVSGVSGRCCSFAPGFPLSGIIGYLTSKHGGTVHDLEIISVTMSGSLTGTNAVDFLSDSMAQSHCRPDPWLCYDFKSMSVKVTAYSIRSRTDCDNYFPLHWTLEGSDDGEHWTELDRRNYQTELLGRKQTGTFPVARSGVFRMIRLRQLGKDSGNTDYLTVSAFELFGTLLGQNLEISK
jgi:hypothetical protein